MALADLKVHRIVSRGHLERAGAELDPYRVVSDYWQPAIDYGKYGVLAD